MQKLICLCAILATMLATSMTREASGLPEPPTKLETDLSVEPKDDSKKLCCCCCGYCMYCGTDGGVEAKKIDTSSAPVEWYSNPTADDSKKLCCCCCGYCMYCSKDAGSNESHIELYSNHTMTK